MTEENRQLLINLKKAVRDTTRTAAEAERAFAFFMNHLPKKTALQMYVRAQLEVCVNACLYSRDQAKIILEKTRHEL